MKKILSITIALVLLLACPLAAFADVQASGRTGSIIVSWDKSKNADGYIVYVSSKEKGTYTVYKEVKGINSTKCTFKDAKGSKTYWFKVKPYYEKDGKRSLGKCLGTDSARTRISAPKGVKASALSSSSIKITWNKVTKADGYMVYRYNASKKKYVCIKTISGSTRTYLDKGLPQQTKKAYRVAAYVKENGKKYKGYVSAKATATTHKAKGITRLMDVARSRLGCPYVSGAAGPNSFDCSGYVYWVFKTANVSPVKFPRSSAAGVYSSVKKYDIGTTSLSKARKGDLLFFGTSKSNTWHVSIYYGNSKSIHAYSTWGKVAITPVSASTYNKKLVSIVRLPM